MLEVGQALENTKMNREKRMEDSLASMTGRIGDLQGALLAERRSREEVFDSLIKRLGAEVVRVSGQLQAEKNARDASQSDLLALVSGLYEKFQGEMTVS